MRNFFSTALLILFTGVNTFCQDQSGPPPPGSDPASTLNYYEILDSRINFFSVDSNYRLLKGTIYTIQRSGFIINLGWDSVQIQGDYYIILTYPDFKKAIQNASTIATQHATPFFRQLSQPYMEKYTSVVKSFIDNLPDSEKAKIPNSPVNQVSPDTVALTSFDPATASEWKRVPLTTVNNLLLCMKKSDFDKLTKRPMYSTAWKWNRFAFASGQLTVPFKLRGATAGQNFTMTTDVTLGAYVGIRKRISKRQNYFITLPVVLGLTYINVNDNSTSTSSSATSGVYPGWTVATGLIFQLGKFNMGFVTGWDYASQVGKSWIYQGKNWVSFGLGYSFLN